MTSAKYTNTCELNDWEWLKIKQEFEATNRSDEWRPIGLAVVGLGRMGSIHLRNILGEPRARLLYCLDGDRSRLELLSSSAHFKSQSGEHSIKFIHSDEFQVALDDPNVHVVIIATPTRFHETLTRRAIEAKKNVLCEKPLTENIGAILPLYELAERNKVYLVTAFNRHYDPDWRRMRQSAVKGRVGCLQLVRIVSRNGGTPNVAYLQTCGSVFHDTCIHDLAMMLWLMRQLPRSVQVTARTWRQFCNSEPDMFKGQMNSEDQRALAQLDDHFLAVITLQFPDGAIGVIDTARYATYGNDQRCEIFGSRGMLKGDARLTTTAHEWNERGVHNAGINYNFASRYAAAYRAELEDVIAMANISLNGKYFNHKEANPETARHLMEYPRGALVAAAAQMADVCLAAAKSAASIEFNWSSELVLRFESEIKL